MKLLLCKNIEKLGIVGDVVDVAPGYGRNYLLPQGLATAPTESNIRALSEARRVAEMEREHHRAEMAELAERLVDVEVTIRAKANEAGVLYGSVGTKEISDALADEGYFVKPVQIVLTQPIRQVDNTEVDIKLTEGIGATVKVWVVREKTEEDEALEAEQAAAAAAKATEQPGPRREASHHGYDPDISYDE